MVLPVYPPKYSAVKGECFFEERVLAAAWGDLCKITQVGFIVSLLMLWCSSDLYFQIPFPYLHQVASPDGVFSHSKNGLIFLASHILRLVKENQSSVFLQMWLIKQHFCSLPSRFNAPSFCPSHPVVPWLLIDVTVHISPSMETNTLLWTHTYHGLSFSVKHLS